ncbi:MAG: 3-hydroxyacyl-CoA dehydrogenase NAD-binding domain-containing protein [Desulfuromonadales bacterium]|jgi:3-hydroxyacyl-CoA dehydrogenase/enoyl-CoA hydratase/3-hydroxybutyryl-CoA epimerase
MSGPILSQLQQRERQLGPLSDVDSTGDRPWTSWLLARDDDDIAWLLFDKRDAAVNVLSEAALNELGEILDGLEQDRPKALVLRSAKDTGFCVGADINEFLEMKDAAVVTAKLRSAHAVVNRLAELPIPTVAIIHGSCLGGGLEVALCCAYRLALPDARMGLPEIRLGLHPGLGGTARLTHLIDPVKAMSLMLTGQTLDARRAKSAGLVDKVIEERHVLRAIQAILSGDLKRQGSGLKERLLTTSPARHLEARQMRNKSAEKVNPQHYPAPEALITLWEEHGDDPEAMREAEIRSFAELMPTATAQNLIRIFFLREKMKRLTKTAAAPVRRVHVVGAGAMGGDIAGWCAYQGLRVTLFDTDPAMIARAVKKTAALCQRKHLSEAGTRDVLDRLIPDPGRYGVAHADLVIEAVPEKIAIKQAVYEEIEPRLKPEAVLATNTSSIPLTELANILQDPGRFVGLHFFNPVAKMQLVEVVLQDRAQDAAIDRAKGFVGQIDRLPTVVASAPGFLVNRVLMPYLMEAIQMVDEGIAAEAIDLCAEAFGMPVGPIELADQVGLDICLDVARMLDDRLDTPMAPIPDWFEEWIAEGRLGRKSGHGFYRWKEGQPRKKEDAGAVDPERTDRLLLPMLNTCVACLRQGVIDDPELLDGAMIFGTGFAPFRGGPLHYARSRGIAEIVATLEKLAEHHGERFKPDPDWQKLSSA